MICSLAAAPIVFGLVALSQGPLTPLLQFLGGAVAAVGPPLSQEPLDMLSVQLHSLALKIGAFIPVQP